MKITESQLRRLVREALLTEAAITPENAKDMDIRFTVSKTEEQVQITAFQWDSPNWAGVNKNSVVVGKLVAMSPYTQTANSPCSNAWEINSSRVGIKGLGPLMYDLMMDVVNPDPLVSDRFSVSPDAKKVWYFYHKKRGDIEEVQLDNLDNFLTTSVKDNCGQESALDWAYTDGDGTWVESSVSKAYRVRGGGTPTLDALQRLKLVTVYG